MLISGGPKAAAALSGADRSGWQGCRSPQRGKGGVNTPPRHTHFKRRPGGPGLREPLGMGIEGGR